MLAADVFHTVFHPAGRGGPIHRRQNRAVWALLRAAGKALEGHRREALLAHAGPILVLFTLAAWMLLWVAGFGLVYYPFVADFLVAPGALRAHWAEALYYSGYTAATLGLGDLVPDHVPLRLLTVVQALGGFALVSVSTTYLLGVYRELILMQTVASHVAGFFRSVDVMQEVTANPERQDAVARWAEGITPMLLHTLQAHFQYPILHYFRAGQTERALPVQLAHLVELGVWVRSRLRHGSPDAPSHPHPSLRSLADAVDTYLEQVERLFVPGGIGRDDSGSGEGTERLYRRLRSHMCY